MNCKQAKTEIALHVGDDLDSETQGVLEQHLADCPGCREYRQKLEASVQLLQRLSDDSPAPAEGSVWPQLLIRLPAEDENRRRRQFNGWMPAAAMAAACLALIAFSTQPAPRQTGTTTLWGDSIPRPISLQVEAAGTGERAVSWPEFRERDELPDNAQLLERMKREHLRRRLLMPRDF